MLYFLLGQFVVYVACWVITVVIAPDFQREVLVLLALLCVLSAAPSRNSRATIKTALQSSCMSRWYPFTIGLIGAAGWTSATIVTRWGLEYRFQLGGVPLAVLLTCTWILVGTLGAVTLTAKIASSRLQHLR